MRRWLARGQLTNPGQLAVLLDLRPSPDLSMPRMGSRRGPVKSTCGRELLGRYRAHASLRASLSPLPYVEAQMTPWQGKGMSNQTPHSGRQLNHLRHCSLARRFHFSTTSTAYRQRGLACVSEDCGGQGQAPSSSVVQQWQSQEQANHCTGEPPSSSSSGAKHQVHGRAQLWDTATTALLYLAALATFADTLGAVTAAGTATATATGITAAASGPWVGMLSTLVSYFILSSVFVADGELGGILCYLGGLLCTFVVFTQAYLAGAVPAVAWCPAALLVTASVAVNACKLLGRLEGPAGVAAWQAWHHFTGLVGWALLPQVAWLTICRPATPSWGPALVSACLGLALLAGSHKLAEGASEGPFRGGTDWPGLAHRALKLWDVPAWTATLLFMAEPAAALSGYLAEPTSLTAASPDAFLLPALITGLQVPRALWLRSHMWFTGTTWSTVFAAVKAALAALALGHPTTAAAVLAALVLWAALLLQLTANAAGLQSPASALRPIARIYSQQLQPLQRAWQLLFGEVQRQAGAVVRAVAKE